MPKVETAFTEQTVVVFEVGDLVKFDMLLTGAVKGKVIDIVPDPFRHQIIIMRVTSRNHAFYHPGIELSFYPDDQGLKKRKRYGTTGRGESQQGQAD